MSDRIGDPPLLLETKGEKLYRERGSPAVEKL